MNLVTPDNEVLWTPARAVTAEDRAMHGETIKAMVELMAAKRGACLAAPQVGLPLAIFVSNQPEFPVAINPFFKAEDFSGHTSKLEGSISRPGWSTYVRRADKIRATFEDAEGNRHEVNLDGMSARIFAHACSYIVGTPIFPRPMRQVIKDAMRSLATNP